MEIVAESRNGNGSKNRGPEIHNVLFVPVMVGSSTR
jgi:hypothetical protein